MSELRSLLLILCVAAVVAGVGAIQEVDQISLWILAFVDQLPPFAWLKPYQLPPPANSEYGFRPISVLMLKLYIYFFGAKALPPLWVLFLKAWLSASLLGFASWRWLRIQGMQKPALPVACMTILLSPHLFGLWSLAELDGLGAASILGVSILLAKPDRVYVENLSLGILIAFSALLKESSALLLFAIMAAEVWISVRKKENWKPRLYWLGVSVFIWLVWASPLIFGLKSNVGAAPWQLRIPLVGFTAWQLLFFASVPGVCLLLLSVVKRPWLPTILGISLFFLPPMVWINHYETIYFSPLWIGVVFSILLYGALFYIAFGPKQRPKQAGVALRILAAKGALITALLLSSSPREDLATRIFLPVAPMLMALIMHRNKGYVSRWDRYAARFLWISCCWFWIGNGINGVIERRAREPLHRKGLVSLVEEPTEKGMVLFNNFAYRLGPDSLQTLRPDASVPDIVFIPDMIPGTRFPTLIWGERYDLEERYRQGSPIWVFWSGVRADFSEPGRLGGSFEWTRRDLGAFQTLKREPQDGMPLHNYIEDRQQNTYKEGRSPLQKLLAQRGTRTFALRNRYPKICPQLYEAPGRVLFGIPFFETYSYDVEVWKVGEER